MRGAGMDSQDFLPFLPPARGGLRSGGKKGKNLSPLRGSFFGNEKTPYIEIYSGQRPHFYKGKSLNRL